MLLGGRGALGAVESGMVRRVTRPRKRTSASADLRDEPILVIGSRNMDLVTRCEHLPRTGQTVFGTDFFTAPGGKGANQAVAAARLGVRVTMAGCVGDDRFGHDLVAGCGGMACPAMPGCAVHCAKSHAGRPGEHLLPRDYRFLLL
jgi:hypothetical protein